MLKRKRQLKKAEENKEEKKSSSYDEEDEKDSGNDDLELYATLLLPFWETSPAVQPLMQQMLKANDKKLKYSIMLQLLQNKKPYPDSLMNYFAGLDDYRYDLYTDLREMKKLDKFPAKYNNHLDLGRSALLDKKSYGKPDSLVYIDRMKARFKDKNGFIYFYKYKNKKDDLSWKLAAVGLTPEDPKEFQFEDDSKFSFRGIDISSLYTKSEKYNRYNFTEFTDTKLEEEEPLTKQLGKALKKLLYSRRKSAKEFYEEDNDRASARDYSIE